TELRTEWRAAWKKTGDPRQRTNAQRETGNRMTGWGALISEASIPVSGLPLSVMNSFRVAGGSPRCQVAGLFHSALRHLPSVIRHRPSHRPISGGRCQDFSIQPSMQSSMQSSIQPSVICHRLSDRSYPKNFNTCSANNAIPSPEKPIRVSVIVHVRRV
ncbi:MAG: hypothetical protein RL079_14, partial [Verrucomicrobiota bacterium]